MGVFSESDGQISKSLLSTCSSQSFCHVAGVYEWILGFMSEKGKMEVIKPLEVASFAEASAVSFLQIST